MVDTKIRPESCSTQGLVWLWGGRGLMFIKAPTYVSISMPKINLSPFLIKRYCSRNEEKHWNKHMQKL